MACICNVQCSCYSNYICTSNCVGQLYDSYKGYTPPRSQTSWTSVSIGGKPRKQYFIELQNVLNVERSYRKYSSYGFTTINVGDKPKKLFYDQLINTINELRSNDNSYGYTYGGFSWNANYNAGAKNSLTALIALRNNLNALQNTCLCNCNNCSCNCNNRSTCSCNNCSCNWECGCNY